MKVKKHEEYRLLAEQLKVRLSLDEHVYVGDFGINIVPIERDAILSIEKIVLFATYHKLYCIVDVEKENNVPRVLLYN